MSLVVVVVHSRTGANGALADAVVSGVRSVRGANAVRMDVPEVAWDVLAAADAIVFGCPTYMGSASASFKAFLEESSARAWVAGAWRDKLAAGFTCSASPSGDKLATLQQLAVFAAQHGMVWVGLDLFPGSALNRLGSNLGAMASAAPGSLPGSADLRTAERLGVRVARAVARWNGQRDDVPAGARHPSARGWVLPPLDPDRSRPELPAPLQRVNLRALMARPERFEHHLVPVARIGRAQLEVVTASEPLAFAHVNRSDEYAAALPTGDALLAGVPLLTLLSDPATGQDAGRVRHHEGDLVLHPHGWLHWPGRLRPPYAPFAFPPGARRAGLSLVFCATEEIGPGTRPIGARADDVKSYGAAVPFGLVDLGTADPGPVAEVDGAVLSVVRGRCAPAAGGWLVVWTAGEAPVHDGDLVWLPPGSALDGVGRGLLLAHLSRAPDPPPATWRVLPEPAFPAFEDGPPGALPLSIDGIEVEAVDDAVARFVVAGVAAEVPRRWAARMLFRIGLHGLSLGYLETYGGLYWDDRGGLRLGARGGPGVELAARSAVDTLERLYRAVAPPGYTERLPD